MSDSNNDDTVTLGSVVDISGIEELKEIFTDILADKKSLTIDASSVERIDTSGLQLLLACQKYLELNDSGIEWLTPSTEFINAAIDLGVHTSLNLNHG